MMNVGGGNRYALGEYHPANESWTTLVQTATIDSGPNSNWEYGGFVGDRFMNIGWNTGGPPMMSATAAVSQQPSSLYTRRPEDLEGNCKVTTSWEVFPGFTNSKCSRSLCASFPRSSKKATAQFTTGSRRRRM